LEKEGLQLKDINIIFLTHYHLDHLLNIRLFPDKDIYDGDTINRGDKIIPFDGKIIPKTKIQIIKTPGHAFEHCSLLVKTNEGNIIIAGDVWWWWNEEKQKIDKKSLLSRKDPFVKDTNTLRKSRQKLLSLADFIIPGHGEMFKVEK
ncbi:MBL fold metallo-hydrolase, partial [Candidatus Parcubacteria bacterium]|nr:MBL fold metallo-hydrolase [Candidatus Parcubacteria bacterium]